jgi:hypothetical protein
MTDDEIVAFAGKITNAKREQQAHDTASEAYSLAITEVVNDPCFPMLDEEKQKEYSTKLDAVKTAVSGKVTEVKIEG